MKTIPVLILTFFFFQITSAQVGALDTTFGTNGNVTHVSYSPEHFEPIDSKELSDGTIMVVSQFQKKIKLKKFNTDGSINTSFGVNGLIQNDFPSLNYAASLVIQTGDKMVVSGAWSNAADDSFLLRYYADGSFDTSFGTNGLLLYPATYYTSRCKSLPDNSFIVPLTQVPLTTSNSFSIVKLTPAGVLDTSFGTNGTASASIFNNLNDICEVNNLIIQPDGKIIVIGKAKTATGTQQYASVRFLPNGSLDATFGVNGIAVYNPFSTPAFLVNINCSTLQSDGKIIIGINYEQYNTDTNARMMCIRLNANGSLDTSYGINGYNFISNDFYTTSNMLLQPDGKLLIVGRSENVATTYSNYILRLNSNGSYDTDFNNTGFNLLPSPLIPGFVEGFLGVYWQPDGKILTLGRGYIGQFVAIPYTMLSRFNSGLLGTESFNKSEVRVFPNPSTGLVYLDNTNSSFKSVQVYNSIGQLISTKTLGVAASASIDLSGYSKGVYLLNFQGEKGGKSCKVVKD